MRLEGTEALEAEEPSDGGAAGSRLLGGREDGVTGRRRTRAGKTSLGVALRCSSCAPDWERRRGLEEEVGGSPQSQERVCSVRACGVQGVRYV